MAYFINERLAKYKPDEKDSNTMVLLFTLKTSAI
jgi:hypothetical protein